MRLRKVAKGIGDFLVETVGEAVAEAVLTLLACLLLGCLVGIAYVSWSLSPRATLAGTGLLSLVLAHGAWTTLARPAKRRPRRRLAAVTAAAFTVTAGVAVYLLLYATDCGCL
ncbi:lysine transporter LysE [Streptomyces sp. NPDC059785]|uniref:lysine transporter LysE n=1 Tax=unclassified Streptomyces TaxID=2593676 RepID=UPI003663FDE1